VGYESVPTLIVVPAVIYSVNILTGVKVTIFGIKIVEVDEVDPARVKSAVFPGPRCRRWRGCQITQIFSYRIGSSPCRKSSRTKEKARDSS
jgi:hypothetical protein